MATPGMQLMDLEIRRTDGTRVPFLYAAVHAVLFYLSWMFPPILLVSLLAEDKRCLHDMLAGVVVTRRVRSLPEEFSRRRARDALASTHGLLRWPTRPRP